MRDAGFEALYTALACMNDTGAPSLPLLLPAEGSVQTAFNPILRDPGSALGCSLLPCCEAANQCVGSACSAARRPIPVTLTGNQLFQIMPALKLAAAVVKSSGPGKWILPDSPLQVSAYLDVILAIPLAKCTSAWRVAPYAAGSFQMVDQAEARIAAVARGQPGNKATLSNETRLIFTPAFRAFRSLLKAESFDPTHAGFFYISRLDTGTRMWACSTHAHNENYLVLDFDNSAPAAGADPQVEEKMRQHSQKIRELEQENTALRARVAAEAAVAGPLPGRKPWFYGKISRDEAKRILVQHIKVPGHFLVRQSNTMAGGWALSLLTAPDDPEPEHHVLQPNTRNIFTINGESLGQDLFNIDDVINFLLRNGHRVLTCRLTDIVYNPLQQAGGRKSDFENAARTFGGGLRPGGGGSMYLPGVTAPFVANEVLVSKDAVGKRVAVAGVGEGTLRFFGTMRDGQQRCGVELDFPVGTTNGTDKGTSYFACKDKHGLFVDPRKVVPVDSNLYTNVRQTYQERAGED